MTLREWLKKNDMNQKDFAEKLGISPAYLSMVMSGKVAVKLELQERISKATKRQVTEIESPESESKISSILPRHMREELIKKWEHVIKKN